MRVNEFINESTFSNAETKLVNRFTELGIEDAAEYFIDWMYRGKFNLPYSELDKYEAAFYLIRSVLSPEIIQSYNNLPVMYRGFSLSMNKIKKIFDGGLPIKSRIMAWTPDRKAAAEYISHNSPGKGVVIKHKPREHEVIISMTPETEKFLGISKFLVANPGETILTLPILNIFPYMLAE